MTAQELETMKIIVANIIAEDPAHTEIAKKTSRILGTKDYNKIFKMINEMEDLIRKI